jgi:hypothetical protein
VASVAEQGLELRRITGSRNDQDFANAGQHQCRERIIDHRFVVDGQQLLADNLSNRPEPASGSAGKDNAFQCTAARL